MTLTRRTVTCMLTAAAAFVALGAASPSFAQSGATWDKIAETGVLSVGLIPNRPPYQFEVDGKQEGLAIQMGEDLAQRESVRVGTVPARVVGGERGDQDAADDRRSLKSLHQAGAGPGHQHGRIPPHFLCPPQAAKPLAHC